MHIPVSFVFGVAALIAIPAHGDTSRCRGLGFERASSGETADVFRPKDDVFLAPVAGLREARSMSSYRYGVFGNEALPTAGRTRDIHFGLVGGGGTFGLWSRRTADGCAGVQLGMSGVVYSQFNLGTGTAEMLNADYVAAIPLTLRWNGWSARVRLLHQSSHLGDELLPHLPQGFRENLGYEAVDLFVSAEPVTWARAYIGIGSVIIPRGHQFERPFGSVGFELRPPQMTWGPFHGLLAIDLSANAATSWSPTTQLMAGLETESPTGPHTMRILFGALAGFTPYGLFFDRERVRNAGLEVQFLY